MRYFKTLALILILLTVAFSNSKVYSQTNLKQRADSIKEEKVIDAILKLKEVKTISAYVDSISKGESEVFLVIEKKPTKDENYYMVRVAEEKVKDTEDSFTPTIYHFFVMPKTYEVKYYDVVLDKAVKLSKWRRDNNKKK